MNRTATAALLLVGPLLAGCGGGGVKQETIEIQVKQSGLDRARAALNRYADGQPIGSEATEFASIVAQVRETEPARADVLEKGFAELQKAPPAQLKAKAKELLKQIAPSPNAG